MSRIAAPASLNARGFDTYAQLTAADYAALKAHGFDFVVRYVENLSTYEVDACLSAGLAIMGVTIADDFNPATTVADAKNNAGLPPGTTLFLDLEGVSLPSAALKAKCAAWANGVKVAGYVPGVYVGAACGLTAEELWELPFVRYWKSASSVPEPAHAGFCMYQLLPCNQRIAGAEVDVDFVQQDFLGRVPTWCVSA